MPPIMRQFRLDQERFRFTCRMLHDMQGGVLDEEGVQFVVRQKAQRPPCFRFRHDLHGSRLRCTPRPHREDADRPAPFGKQNQDRS